MIESSINAAHGSPKKANARGFIPAGAPKIELVDPLVECDPV
jgi:hypothetical protein